MKRISYFQWMETIRSLPPPRDGFTHCDVMVPLSWDAFPDDPAPGTLRFVWNWRNSRWELAEEIMVTLPPVSMRIQPGPASHRCLREDIPVSLPPVCDWKRDEEIIVTPGVPRKSLLGEIARGHGIPPSVEFRPMTVPNDEAGIPKSEGMTKRPYAFTNADLERLTPPPRHVPGWIEPPSGCTLKIVAGHDVTCYFATPDGCTMTHRWDGRTWLPIL